MTTGIILIVGFCVLMVIGIPIYLALFCSTTIAALFTGIDPLLIVQRSYSSNDSFPMLAILFFCVAGDLMLQGGIGIRIINVCKLLARKSKARLTNISIMACAFFGAISGSGYATTTTIGKLMYPEMVKEGYDPSFASALQAVAGTLGVLIPPSMACVIYGNVTGESVGDMLLWILPVGLITTVLYMLIGRMMINRKKNPVLVLRPAAQAEEEENINVGKVLLDAVPALLTPVIILGGIYLGVFTPTECAVVASVYSWIVGTFVYKELNLKTTVKSLIDSAMGSAAIMMMVNSAGVMSWELAYYGLVKALGDFVITIISSKIGMLLAINVVYFISGMFFDSSVIQLIIVPLLYPIAMRYGINGIHLGLITVLNPALGTVTPPFGGAVFVANTITRAPVDEQFKHCMPFILGGFIWCLILTYVPLIWL